MHPTQTLFAAIPDCTVWIYSAAMSDKVSISIRIDPELHEQLVKAADKARSPLNGEIQRRLALSLEREARDLREPLERIERTVNAIATTLLEKVRK